MEFLSKSLEDTAKIASNFANSLEDDHQGKATVVGLYGELGSGKTTFMKYLAESLGVKEEIKSPTFVIMKFFDLTPRFASPSPCQGEGLQTMRGEDFHLIHIDAYRIENPEEMLNLGWQENISDPKNLICIEWPEKITNIMPPHIKIFFEHISENERKIKIEK